jgi:hypothetical protein
LQITTANHRLSLSLSLEQCSSSDDEEQDEVIEVTTGDLGTESDCTSLDSLKTPSGSAKFQAAARKNSKVAAITSSSAAGPFAAKTTSDTSRSSAPKQGTKSSSSSAASKTKPLSVDEDNSNNIDKTPISSGKGKSATASTTAVKSRGELQAGSARKRLALDSANPPPPPKRPRSRADEQVISSTELLVDLKKQELDMRKEALLAKQFNQNPADATVSRERAQAELEKAKEEAKLARDRRLREKVHDMIDLRARGLTKEEIAELYREAEESDK